MGLFQVIRPYPSSLSLARGIMTRGNLKLLLFSTHSHPTSASSYSELASSTTTSESCSSLGVPQSGSGSGAGTKPSPGHLRRFRPGEESARKRLHDLTSRLSRITWKNNNHAPWANFVTVTFQSYINEAFQEKNPIQASDLPRIGFIRRSLFCDLSILHNEEFQEKTLFKRVIDPDVEHGITQNWFYQEVSFIKLCLKECHLQTRIWWISTFVAWCFCPHIISKR